MTTEPRVNVPISVRQLLVTLQHSGNEMDSRRVLVGPLDLTVRAGETMGLVGESGSGKTLTLRALAGIPPSGVIVRHSGCEYRGVRKSAIVFQDPMGFFNPRWRIYRSLAEVLRVVRGLPRSKLRERSDALLRDVGLEPTDGRLFPFEMSGGMVQRAAIAMALAVDPAVLLADEVTSALDPDTRDRILRLLCRVGRERGAATVVVSHDVGSLVHVVDRLVVLYAGQSVEEGPPSIVLGTPRHRYTDFLVRSVPGAETRGTRLPEMPPDTDTIVTGCPFSGRCPAAQARCYENNPDWSGPEEQRYRCHFPVPGNRDDQ